MNSLRRAGRRAGVAALVVSGLLSGCAGSDGRTESAQLRQCKSVLGAGHVESAVDAMGSSDVEASGTRQADALAENLVREAKLWQESDLLHNTYLACRLDAFEDDRISSTVEVTVKWSVLSLNMMDKLKTARTWSQVNETLYVAPDPDQARTQLLAGCAVPGAIASQASDLPLQFDVGGKSLGGKLRWDILSAFARSVVAEMDCVKPPVIPSALPAAA